MRYTKLEQDPSDIRGTCKTYLYSRADGPSFPRRREITQPG